MCVQHIYTNPKKFANAKVADDAPSVVGRVFYQASPVVCFGQNLPTIYTSASFHGKKNELNTEIYRNLVFSSEGIKG